MARPAARIPPTVLGQIATEWMAASRGDRCRVIEVWARHLGVAPITVRRALKGYNRRWELSDTAMHRAAAVLALAEAMTALTACPFPVSDAIRLAIQLRLIDAPISRTTVAVARRRLLGTPAPRRIRRNAPNALWGADFSTFESLAFDPESGTVHHVTVGDGYYRRKVAGTTPASRVWVGVIVDYATGVMFADVFPGRAESTEVAAELFCAAAADKDWSICGLPQLFYTDPAPWAHREGAFRRTLEEVLGVRATHHAPGHPQSKGRVEVVFRHMGALENSISSALRLGSGKLAVGQLRGYLHAWVRERNRRHGRLERYRAAGIRGVDIAPTLFFRVDTRRVQPDRSLEYKGVDYWVPPEVPVGQDVRVVQLGDTVYAIHAGVRWELVPVEGCPVYPFRDWADSRMAQARAAVRDLLKEVPTDVLVQLAVGLGDNIVPFRPPIQSSQPFNGDGGDWGSIVDLLDVPPPPVYTEDRP